MGLSSTDKAGPKSAFKKTIWGEYESHWTEESVVENCSSSHKLGVYRPNCNNLKHNENPANRKCTLSNLPQRA